MAAERMTQIMTPTAFCVNEDCLIYKACFWMGPTGQEWGL